MSNHKCVRKQRAQQVSTGCSAVDRAIHLISYQYAFNQTLTNAFIDSDSLIQCDSLMLCVVVTHVQGSCEDLDWPGSRPNKFKSLEKQVYEASEGATLH